MIRKTLLSITITAFLGLASPLFATAGASGAAFATSSSFGFAFNNGNIGFSYYRGTNNFITHNRFRANRRYFYPGPYANRGYRQLPPRGPFGYPSYRQFPLPAPYFRGW